MENFGHALLDAMKKSYGPQESKKELTREDVKFLLDQFQEKLEEINREVQASVDHMTRAAECLAEERKEQQQLERLIVKFNAFFPEEEKK